jgi:hypothetical protein
LKKILSISILTLSFVYAETEQTLAEKEIELLKQEIELLKLEQELKSQKSDSNYIAPPQNNSYRSHLKKSYSKHSNSSDVYVKVLYGAGSEEYGIDNNMAEDSISTNFSTFILGFGGFNENRWELKYSQYSDEYDYESSGIGFNYLWVWNKENFNPYVGLGMEMLNSDNVADDFDASGVGVGINLSFGVMKSIKDVEISIGLEYSSHSYPIDSYCTDYEYSYYYGYSSCNEYETINYIENRTLLQIGAGYRF